MSDISKRVAYYLVSKGYSLPIDATDCEINYLLLEDLNYQVRTIKRCVLFFAAIAIVSILAGIILAIIITSGVSTFLRTLKP